MTAKKMFENLDYTLQELETCLHYYKGFRDFDGDYWENYIDFDLKDKEIDAPYPITLNELQAINKQVEELGWNK